MKTKTNKPSFSVKLFEHDRRTCIARCQANSRNRWLLLSVLGLAKRVWGRKRVAQALKNT